MNRWSKYFDHRNRETEIYKQWENGGHFKPRETGKPYYIPMPPPNITGKLHLGHALFATLQDISIRHHRALGDAACWLPGTDHAGIATQQKIEALLESQGIEITENNFYYPARQWADDHIKEIRTQLKSLGASADWSRERFTLDPQMTKATIEAFNQLHEQKLIYECNGNWYFKTHDLAQRTKEAIISGEIEIIPKSSAHACIHMLENNHDWEISRSIWWGQQIPAWKTESGHWIIARNINEAMKKAGTSNPADLEQCKSRLDTWFSSSLWTFAALGWPDKTSDFERFFPAALLETGADILYFWAARSIMMSLALTNLLPFRKIYLHGMIRDEDGEKMSKSKGNGIDPLTLSTEFGTDALRYALAYNTHPGSDLNLTRDKLTGASRFLNKLYQAGKYLHSLPASQDSIDDLSSEDLEMLRRTEHICQSSANDLTLHNYSSALKKLSIFFKHEFCNQYLESSKAKSDTSAWAMRLIYGKILMSLHPFTPFITEELWQNLEISESYLMSLTYE
jgi:valyl-tRNA synthetase